jgi:tRNA A-37 threonylcarbamoyl transferase component Bud32
MTDPSHDLERLARQEHRVLKQEAATTVESFGRGDEALVKKTYRNRGVRLLQTFARRCRAAREFDNLRAIERLAVPCTAALWWSERRRLGFVTESVLATRLLEDSQTLKDVLAGLPATGHEARRRLVEAMGRLVADLHRGGFLWCTPMPRNVLVLGDPAQGRLAVCDTPAGADLGRSLHGTALACIDVFDAAFSPSRRADFSATDRWRWLRAYCAGDPSLARALWRRLAHRSVWRHDLGRALAMLWHTYILSALRRPRPMPPAPRR